MKALDYAIRTEDWELAALCLVAGAMEALAELPPDAVDELMSELDVDEGECAPRPYGPSGHKRLRGPSIPQDERRGG
jgi:hypothetical protein